MGAPRPRAGGSVESTAVNAAAGGTSTIHGYSSAGYGPYIPRGYTYMHMYLLRTINMNPFLEFNLSLNSVQRLIRIQKSCMQSISEF